MTAIAIPIYGMYELSIIFIRLFGRREQPEPASADVPAPPVKP